MGFVCKSDTQLVFFARFLNTVIYLPVLRIWRLTRILVLVAAVRLCTSTIFGRLVQTDVAVVFLNGQFLGIGVPSSARLPARTSFPLGADFLDFLPLQRNMTAS